MRLGDVVVEVRDLTLRRVGCIDPQALNVRINDAFNGVGEWGMRLPSEHPMAAALSEPGSGIVVSTPGGTLFSGPTVSLKSVATRQDREGTLEFSGASDSVILGDPLCYPTPANPSVASQKAAGDQRTGTCAALMAQYVNANIGPGAPAVRRTAGLTLGDLPIDQGPVVTKSPRWQILGEVLSELALLADLGFRVIQVGDGLVFQVYHPRDRSRLIRLDVASGTVASSELIQRVPGITHAIAGGENHDGTERMYGEFVTDASVEAQLAWNRRIERFVAVNGNELTSQGLANAAAEALAESGFTAISAKVRALDTDDVQYARDWFLGDRVSVIAGGRQLTASVDRVGVDIGPNGLTIQAEFGDEYLMVGASPMLIRLARRVSALERARVSPDAGGEAGSGDIEDLAVIGATEGPEDGEVEVGGHPLSPKEVRVVVVLADQYGPLTTDAVRDQSWLARDLAVEKLLKFAVPQLAAERNISEFEVVVRTFQFVQPGVPGSLSVEIEGAFAATPASHHVSLGAGLGIREFRFGPFRKPGGGMWTVTEIQEMRARLKMSSAPGFRFTRPFGQLDCQVRHVRARVAYGGATFPPLDAVEESKVNSLSGYTFGQVVGDTQDGLGALSVLGDASDATYIDSQLENFVDAQAGFLALKNANGRGISSFVVVARCGDIAGTAGVSVFRNGQFVFPTQPATASVSHPGGLGDVVIGPFTKPGGGNWTVAEVESASIRVYFTGPASGYRLYRITRRVTYAT